MKSFFEISFAAVFVLLVSGFAFAQTWNSNAGGYNGGYGQVYQTFGLAQATMNMQQTTQMQIQKLMMKQAMEKKWGKKAVADAERKAANSGSSRTTSSPSNNSSSNSSNTAQTYVSKNYAVFKPAQNNNFQLIADTIGTTNEEKTLLTQIFTETKKAYEGEVAPKGRKNNLAAAMTFFIVANLTVYHDVPEPTDTATENLFLALNQMIDETPDMVSVPNKDKQFLHDTFVSFSGLVFATYLEAKQTNNKETLKVAQQLAGGLLQEILKINAAKVRFEGDTLKFEQ